MDECKKIIVVGEASVGKTSILNRWLHDCFSFETAPTIGAGMSPMEINVDGNPQLFHVWDTAGTPQFRSVVPMYCRQAAIAIIVFDITKRNTFEKIPEWVSFVRENASPVFVLVGNKIDLEDERDVQKAEEEQTAESIGCKCVEVSACTNEGMKLFIEEMENAARDSLRTFVKSQSKQIEISKPGCNC
ncbi:ras-related protein Rab-22A-like [Histomonas meleagridis]|uniref:ras-related protein Rab-22A-like n=1 Tax=Histomonas meleagridis TaxID=135588 RepID=UPI00355A8AE0|nr:ras-related protein Rab-22A-like [Histomonas meleagridis]KAH0805467.1 ras-related protein Rab-22A-like [Histomonas meleagridis]